MISGSRPLVAEAMTRARGFSPSSVAFSSEVRSGAVVQRAGVAGRHTAVLPKRRLQLRELLHGRARTRAVVLVDLPLVRGLDGDDLPIEEAGVA